MNDTFKLTRTLLLELDHQVRKRIERQTDLIEQKEAALGLLSLSDKERSSIEHQHFMATKMLGMQYEIANKLKDLLANLLSEHEMQLRYDILKKGDNCY